MSRSIQLAALLSVCIMGPLAAAPPEIDTTRGDRMLAEYFRAETRKLSENSLADIKSLADWQSKKAEYRGQLLEMLGLDPLPEMTDLKATVTGTTEHDEFVVERLHFQSRPGLYVTGNLYRPKRVTQPLPAILYVCGHGKVKIDGVSYGNKVHYQHHGAWFARNGYVCLTIDTLQMGEIEATHHGTYGVRNDKGGYDTMLWWLNRGYTSAGVEAWNCIRALDYLQTRKEVDPGRLGVTGRSGGGAYSWWIAAIDERIKCAVPVAGITDLQNHVVDGTVEGHCDCMFMVNTYRWDYAKVAALVAPRPLLISNTDTDRIFPLDGVYRTFEQTRRIYGLHKAADKVALHITAGGHKDTQELRVHAFRWFNFHLKGETDLIEKTAVKYFEPEQLKVFDELPADELNTEIHETFVPLAENPLPKDEAAWKTMRDGWIDNLRKKSFGVWPEDAGPINGKTVAFAERQGIAFKVFDFNSDSNTKLRMYVAHQAGLEKPDLVVLNVLDDQAWTEFLATYRAAFEEELKGESLPDADQDAFKSTQAMFANTKWAMAYVAPRGIGPTAWNQSERKQTQHQRRFYLLGQSLDGMRVFDVRRSIQGLRMLDEMKGVPVWLQSHRQMAAVTVYASLFEPEITRLDLHEIPNSHRNGPYLLNVRRFLDVPQAVAMAAENSRVAIYNSADGDWQYVQDVAENLNWDKKQIQLRSFEKK